MKIAITGGTGFIGRHLARDLIERGHEVTIIARGKYSRNNQPVPGANFVALDINETNKLKDAFRGCDAVAHCAGTSVEDGKQTFHKLHVEGTRSAVKAAEEAGVKKFVLVSYLNVRPTAPSAYHTTKWAGEEIVRASKLNFTILKAGLVYGPGDHLLNNLSNLFRKMPVFATVGLKEKTVRLVAVEDLVAIIRVCLLEEERFSRIKHYFGFPDRAVRFCLDSAGLTGADLDAVVFFEKPFVKFERILMTSLQTFPRAVRLFGPTCAK